MPSPPGRPWFACAGRWDHALAGNEKRWCGIFSRRVEPEPNRYADIGERNSRVSIVVYATPSENNSSYVCDGLKEVTKPTRGVFGVDFAARYSQEAHA